MPKIITDPEKIKKLLARGVEEIIVKKDLGEKLKSGKRLRIKLGVDPSRPDIHLGHFVVLKKLKEFQDMGHQAVFIIGDFTGMIGDPSGKSKTRPALSKEEVLKNAKTYFDQAGKILNFKKIEVRYNSTWFCAMGWEDILKLVSKFTVARILERDDFSKRLKSGNDIAISEIMYPIMQAYDSIEVAADVELGGTDQKFNMLAGRDLQRKMNLPEQNIITVPLLVGLDGAQKMSKSLDNYIGVAENANSMFGKIMSIPDSLITNYFTLLTDLSDEELEKIKADLKNPKINPRDMKVRLAKEIITFYHSQKSAEAAETEFNKVFRDKGVPSEIPEIKISEKTSCSKQGRTMSVLDLLVKTKLVSSKSEAKRLVEGRAVEINGKTISGWKKVVEIKNGMVIRAGKRRFARITV
ncbi:tyrosine--tRNA ligase [Patescibacteria group bacterium]|nr:tyrosine--tRNA ligase [Patescibacteria group bacterium]MBU3999844.1 tyrosine--tRNA ligase [Patescibacteria group bacterium]MBU4057139.1 tyrosine--tRNA ligase [Patescibacteria group bacterium]MBU4369098.1 tyrosine--tRNA ligase [Patescibacteria group bacterium]